MPSLSKWRRQLKRTPSSNRRGITSGVTTNTQYVADPRGAAQLHVQRRYLAQSKA
jgi:hypothetical protein